MRRRRRREGGVEAKGKGHMVTYWVGSAPPTQDADGLPQPAPSRRPPSSPPAGRLRGSLAHGCSESQLDAAGGLRRSLEPESRPAANLRGSGWRRDLDGSEREEEEEEKAWQRPRRGTVASTAGPSDLATCPLARDTKTTSPKAASAVDAASSPTPAPWRPPPKAKLSSQLLPLPPRLLCPAGK